MSSFFSPLAHPVFRWLFFGQVVSLLGTGLATVALALMVYELSPLQAGLVLGSALAVKMVAYLGVAPWSEVTVMHFPAAAGWRG